MTVEELKDTKDPLPGSLIGLDSNAFALMGYFQRVARRQGWTQEEIKIVIDYVTSGDYNNLVVTLDQFFED